MYINCVVKSRRCVRKVRNRRKGYIHIDLTPYGGSSKKFWLPFSR